MSARAVNGGSHHHVLLVMGEPFEKAPISNLLLPPRFRIVNRLLRHSQRALRVLPCASPFRRLCFATSRTCDGQDRFRQWIGPGDLRIRMGLIIKVLSWQLLVYSVRRRRAHIYYNSLRFTRLRVISILVERERLTSKVGLV